MLLQQQKSAEDSQRQLELEIKQLREGHTEQYLKDLKARERQLELLLRQAEDMVLPSTTGSIPGMVHSEMISVIIFIPI